MRMTQELQKHYAAQLEKYEKQLETVRGQKAQLEAQMQQLEQNFIRLTAVENQLIGALIALEQIDNERTSADPNLPAAGV